MSHTRRDDEKQTNNRVDVKKRKYNALQSQYYTHTNSEPANAPVILQTLIKYGPGLNSFGAEPTF